jgi:ubiquinone/menaquinone biosynthesis C-methylase UbiE
MAASYDPVKYKISAMQSFLTRNLVALGYDRDWESKNRGPFRSTAGLTMAAGIRANHFVLDVGCGTGVVSREVARRLASFGLVIGFDFSWGALSITKSSVPSGHFVEMDAENIEMRAKFDRTVCQHALMFFPDLAKALVQLRALLNEETGWLAVAVHRTPQSVPYFRIAMEPVLRHIPDIKPTGAPNIHYRFGNPDDLKRVISAEGFSGVSIKKSVFEHQAGTFGEVLV